MRVVALVSGGKDSCYSMMKCVEHGHTIVALANLHPPTPDVDEMDSFMYQTVGHQHVDAIAQSMELPLFRQEIGGSAVLQGMRYERTEGDEVEDLLTLLATVQRCMPSVEAVCSGAILSNYQRYRVEDVCARLGLASLSYLWQRRQDELLQEMVTAGVHAVLVKVCSLQSNPNPNANANANPNPSPNPSPSPSPSPDPNPSPNPNPNSSRCAASAWTSAI
jgi:diphthine-ammonia ligase